MDIMSNMCTTANSGSRISSVVNEITHILNEEKNKCDKPTESKKTKSKLVNNGRGMLVVEQYKDGHKVEDNTVMPDVVNIREFNDENGNPCAIYLDFADRTSTCAARRDNDVFNFEHGVTICIAKKLLDMITGSYGSQTYNKIVRRVCKLHDQIIKKEEDALKLKEEYEHKLEKMAEKKRKRMAKREAEMLEEENQLREHLIEIQKEAFVRALKECGFSGDDLK